LGDADRTGSDALEPIDRLGETRRVQPAHELRNGDGKDRASEGKSDSSFDRRKGPHDVPSAPK
jgi:hypothetical protein